jgi:3-deoxy-alpha-D-manno-octulosonate 8-oxidase
MYRIVKSVPSCLFGRGSFDQLQDILKGRRGQENSRMAFLVDDFFRDKRLAGRIPVMENDTLIWVNVDDEPKTSVVDKLRDQIASDGKQLPSAVIGIGGGSTMDYAKAVSVMLKNPGSSELYQGLNLIKNEGVYHIGIPTLSGTGAEVSMTAVLTGPVKKLGIKGEFTPFDMIILDPELINRAPKNQRFYTGMDSFIHNVESLTGLNRNSVSDSYAIQSKELCRQVFLNERISREEADEKLMVASYFGGLSIGFSEVGVCHALSYGLSYVLGLHHRIANCIAFNQLEDVYGEDVREFHMMVTKNDIDIPAGISAGLREEQIYRMADIAIKLDHMWNHAYGPGWKEQVTHERIMGWFRRM